MTPATRIWSSASGMSSNSRDLMRVARIGEGQHEAADLGLQDHRQDVLERHVAVVRALVIAPADVQPDAVARDALQRLG